MAIDPNQPDSSISALPTSVSGSYINPAYVTPEQAAQMRLYANSLVKQGQTMPVHRWTQGVAQMLNAGLGGYFSGQADQQQRALQNQGAQGEATANSIVNPPSQSSPVPDNTQPAPATSSDNNNEVMSYAEQSAIAHGIDPKVGIPMLMGESGARPDAVGDDNSSFGPLQLHYGGISKKFPNSGLGDAFTAATGLDAKDPSTWKQQIDFGFDQASKNGWSPWATTRDKMGIDNRTGIGTPPPVQVASNDMNAGLTPAQAAINSQDAAGFAAKHPQQVAQSAIPDSVSAYAAGSVPPGAFTQAGPVPANLKAALPAPPNGVASGVNPGAVPNMPPPNMGGGTPATAAPQGAPAVAAMASALRGGAPLQGGGQVTPQTISALRGQSAQVDPRQVGAILSNPMVSPETKQMVRQYFTPQMMEGPFGSRQLGTQSQIMAGQSLAPAPGPGITGIVGAGPASVPVTTNLGPSGPVSTPLVPGGATPQGPIKSGGGTAFSPASPIGQMATDAGKIATINNNVSAVGAAQTAEYQKAREEMEPTRQAAYNLHSLSTELDKGVPQGPGASEYAKGGAMFNFAAKLLGVDTSDINSPTSVIQLINKYGTGQSINLAGRIREGKPTNYDLETAKEVSPGSEMDPKAAAHLTDNLARLNDLYYKQLNDKAQYYEDHQSQPNPLSGWSQSWQQKISGKNAVPLSKDPIWSGEIDGIPTDKVLTSDPKGFTYMRKGTWK